MSNAPASRARRTADAKKTPAQRAVADIAAGKCDAELMAISEAIGARAMTGAVFPRWKVEFDGMVITEDNVTLDEAFLMQEQVGVHWSNLDPLSSAGHGRAVLLAGYQVRKGLDEDAAKAKVATLTVGDVLGAIGRYYDADTPTTPPA